MQNAKSESLVLPISRLESPILSGDAVLASRAFARFVLFVTLLTASLAFFASRGSAQDQPLATYPVSQPMGVVTTSNDGWLVLQDTQPTQAPAPEPVIRSVGLPAEPSTEDASATPPDNQAAADAAKKEKEAAEKRNKAFTGAYKPVFYDNDFSYLRDPAFDKFWIGDSWKQRCLFGHVRLDVGGEYRFRLHNERNMRGLGLTGVDDDFGLHRTRIFANAKLSQVWRAFGEFIDAESNWENNAPRAIEVNRTDFLNLFVDGVIYRDSDATLTARVGRQELIYGEQRLISPLDWANTRRTFDGVKFLYARGDWKIDSFWTQPVIVDDHSFDHADENQQFMGMYATYSGIANQPREYYVLRQTNTNVGQGFEFNTVGTRQTGEFCCWQTLAELAYQFGRNNDGSDHSAGMATIGTGRKLSDSAAQPTLWFYYDFASGGDDLGQVQGFHHHFPLAHKYLGFMDPYGRSNIEDFNFTYSWKAAEKLQMLVWYHYFTLATAGDTPYSVVMTPFNPTNAPASVRLGQEIDLLATWAFHPRQELLFGYSHFFAGAYYENTPGVPFTGDADFFYTQYQIRF